MKIGTLILKDELVRRCHMCGKPKKLKEFYKDSTKNKGYAYQCKECHKEQSRKWHLKTREKRLEYYKAHKEQRLQDSKRYYSSDKGKATSKRSRQSPKWKVGALNRIHTRRVRLLNCTISDLTTEQARLLLKTARVCPVCREPFDKADPRKRKSFDHIVPVSKEGNHTLSNTQVLCQRCNSKKGTRLVTNRQLRAELALA